MTRKTWFSELARKVQMSRITFARRVQYLLIFHVFVDFNNDFIMYSAGYGKGILSNSSLDMSLLV